MIRIDGDIPSVNHIWRTTVINKRPVTYMTKEGKEFKQRLAWLAKAAKLQYTEKPIKFYFEWHCKGKGRGDLDNRSKLLQDALIGIAYKDDSQVVEIHAKKIQNSFNGAIIEVTEA